MEFAAGLVDDPEWRKSFAENWKLLKIPPQIVIRMMEYRFGKPPEVIELQDETGAALKIDTSKASKEQLAQLLAIAKAIHSTS